MAEKWLHLTEDMTRRVRRNNYIFDCEKCLVCGHSFDTCPHSIVQNERAAQLVKDLDGII